MNDLPRYIRLHAVMGLTGLSKSTIYTQIAAGKFPKPRKLTGKATGWREDEVRVWLESREAA